VSYDLAVWDGGSIYAELHERYRESDDVLGLAL
jgi:hypothetical protein